MAAIALTATISGCSGPGPDEPGLRDGKDGVTAVVRTLTAGLTVADSPRACAQLDRFAQEAIEKETRTDSCLKAVEGWKKSHAGIREVVPTEETITLNGESATVTLDPADATALGGLARDGKLSLGKVESRWTVLAPR